MTDSVKRGLNIGNLRLIIDITPVIGFVPPTNPSPGSHSASFYLCTCLLKYPHDQIRLVKQIIPLRKRKREDEKEHRHC